MLRSQSPFLPPPSSSPSGSKTCLILIPFRLVLLFCLSICISFVNAQESPPPKLKERQLNGVSAALDDGYSGVKTKAFEKLTEYDAKDLKALPKQSEEIA